MIVAAFPACLLAGAAFADCNVAPSAESFAFATAAAGPTDDDGAGRIVAPILVNGQGPFRFIVDTGANRSVLSNSLAARLGLAADGHGPVHSVHGVVTAPLVRVESLRYGEVALANGEVPMLGGPVLAGEHGLLGVDGMVDRLLVLDFRRDCIEILPSRNLMQLRGRGWTALPGQLRFGHLIVVRGRIEGVDINVLIDTGSDTSLANNALREAIHARRARRHRGEASTIAEPVMLDDAVVLPRIALSTLEVRDVIAFVGDFHIFGLWGLQSEPTLLLGMDVISQTDALAIDYGRSTVHFRISRWRR
jgi:predicted aspartyl protease